MLCTLFYGVSKRIICVGISDERVSIMNLNPSSFSTLHRSPSFVTPDSG